jgi:hypothetical protein
MFELFTIVLLQIFSVTAQPTDAQIGGTGWGGDAQQIGGTGWGGDAQKIGGTGWGGDAQKIGGTGWGGDVAPN